MIMDVANKPLVRVLLVFVDAKVRGLAFIPHL